MFRGISLRLVLRQLVVASAVAWAVALLGAVVWSVFTERSVAGGMAAVAVIVGSCAWLAVVVPCRAWARTHARTCSFGSAPVRCLPSGKPNGRSGSRPWGLTCWSACS